MAIHLHHGQDGNDYPETPDINVTPFIDVILVLLIIFMVAAPLATVDVPVDLPVSSARAEPPPGDPIVFSIQANRQWSVGDQRVSRDALGSTLDAASRGDHSARVFVRADKAVPYEALIEAMDALRARGYLKISLVGLDEANKP